MDGNVIFNWLPVASLRFRFTERIVGYMKASTKHQGLCVMDSQRGHFFQGGEKNTALNESCAKRYRQRHLL
jgi:hypothetical protein